MAACGYSVERGGWWKGIFILLAKWVISTWAFSSLVMALVLSGYVDGSMMSSWTRPCCCFIQIHQTLAPIMRLDQFLLLVFSPSLSFARDACSCEYISCSCLDAACIDARLFLSAQQQCNTDNQSIAYYICPYWVTGAILLRGARKQWPAVGRGLCCGRRRLWVTLFSVVCGAGVWMLILYLLFML